MKKIPLIIFFLITINSCKDKDSEEVPLIIGDWKLQNVTLEDFSDGFKKNSGVSTPASQLFTEYNIKFNPNNLYIRNATVVAINTMFGEDLNDTGSWTLVDNILTLASPSLSEDEIWEVTLNNEQNLQLSFSGDFQAVPDIFIDTLSIEYSNSLSISELQKVIEEVSTVVPIRVDYFFGKSL